MNEQSYLEQSRMPELARAVIAQCGGWDAFVGISNNVCDHGADDGFNGWICYRETVEFAKKNLPAIRAQLQGFAHSTGKTVNRGLLDRLLRETGHRPGAVSARSIR
jgi:hypothetical protein